MMTMLVADDDGRADDVVVDHEHDWLSLQLSWESVRLKIRRSPVRSQIWASSKICQNHFQGKSIQKVIEKIFVAHADDDDDEAPWLRDDDDVD